MFVPSTDQDEALTPSRTTDPAAGSARPSVPTALPTLWEVLDELGLGMYQVQAQLVGGGMFLADGAEIQTIAVITLPLSKELGLSPNARGSLVSIVYVGVLVGSIVSGYLGDTFGRRAPIILGFAMLAVLAIISSYAKTFMQLVALRALFGVFYGVGGPCWNTMAAEITPKDWRMVIAGTSQVYFQIGELYAIFITWLNDPMMVEVDWRWQLVMSAVPAMTCLVLALILLDETPAFLAVHGQLGRARQVLERVRRLNGRTGTSVEFTPPVLEEGQSGKGGASGWQKQLGIVFGRHLLFTSLTLAYSYIVINFIFYGNLYAFPQVMPAVSQSHDASPTVSMALGVLTGEIPGVLAGALFGSLVPRRFACALYLQTLSLSSLVFGLVIDLESPSYAQSWALCVSYIGLRFSVNFGFVILWQYTAESFPTVVRATGCAAAFGAGRLGAISAPPVFERLQVATGQARGFFILCSVICLVNVFPLWAMRETHRQNLSDSMEDLEKLMGPDDEPRYCEPRVQ